MSLSCYSSVFLVELATPSRWEGKSDSSPEYLIITEKNRDYRLELQRETLPAPDVRVPTQSERCRMWERWWWGRTR